MGQQVNYSWKIEGIPSSSQGHFNTTILHVPDATSDADIEAVGASLQGLSNGLITSISKSIVSGVLGPYGLASLNGGTNKARVLARSATRKPFQFVIPFLRNNATKAQIEAALEEAATIVNLENEYGEGMGNIVNVRLSEIFSATP